MASEIVRVVANRATTETLAEHLCERERRLTLTRELEASEAAKIGDKARQSIASTESERHRYSWAQLQLIVDDDFKSLEALEARVRELGSAMLFIDGLAKTAQEKPTLHESSLLAIRSHAQFHICAALKEGT